MSVTNLQMAMTIAIRYSAARRQFSLEDREDAPETPVLDYQMQQWRLMPLLSATYVLHVFIKSFFMDLVELQVKTSIYFSKLSAFFVRTENGGDLKG